MLGNVNIPWTAIVLIRSGDINSLHVTDIYLNPIKPSENQRFCQMGIGINQWHEMC